MTNKINERHWPHLCGHIIEEKHVLPVRVYYEDTDFSGIVYHAAYLKFLERGRTDFLRLRDVHHNQLAAGIHGEALAFAVRHMDIDFLKSAHIDDVLEVHTEFSEIRGARMILTQGIMRGEEELLRASVTAVMISSAGKPRRFPKELLARINGKIAS